MYIQTVIKPQSMAVLSRMGQTGTRGLDGLCPPPL